MTADTTNNRDCGFTQLAYREDGPVGRITLWRPRVRNALSMELSEDLVRAIELARESRSLRVVVVDGAGETFCAGDDITEMPGWGDANDVVRRVRSYQRMADELEGLDKITIAAVDGYAVGGGLEITMACDFVLATERARWGMPEVDSGITPGWGGTTRLSRLVGRSSCKEINLIGALFPARRAVELGLWNRVVPNSELDAEVARLCEVLCSKNQQALRQLKVIIDRGAEGDLHTAQGFELLSAGFSAAVNGAWEIEDCDSGQGVRDFAEKGDLWRHRRELARDFWTS
ncbi:MAG TPA: enoyl-CoA hydratase/isomerase family protein [Solirubrobacteraceae bacterium]|nr:enoyl-CoA hydratase/isomerase family protein [Solirubrobacteraceae bacterium]